MIRRLAALILLTAVSLIQTAEVPRLISLTLVEPGDNVTLRCQFSEKDNFIHWYKQPLGHISQTVATGNVIKITVSEQFKESRFTVTKEDAQYSLIIRNVSKEDEATYFCQKGTSYTQTFVNGTFLAVNDNNQKSVHVKQTPETASVHLGDALTLQCSLLSKNITENTDQCPGVNSVYWFRPGSGGFHPGVIYTHRNRSDERVERSCVYSLSKTIQDSSDTGTYYCAVVTCGAILFGEGTKVDARSGLDPVVLVLGVLLACCVTVIAILIFYINGRRVCDDYKGAKGASDTLESSTVDQSNDLDGETKAVNYAALDFSTMMKRGNKTRRENTQCVYSDVRTDYHTQQHPSL